MIYLKLGFYEIPPFDFTGCVEYPNGNKTFYKEGKHHRENGPAIEYSHGTKRWFKEGKRHREDGPAVEYGDGRKSWFLEDIEYIPINLKDFLILDYYNGECGIVWHKFVGKDRIFEYPDIPGLIIK